MRRAESGNTILEFALVMTFLVPMFAGAFTIGMALTKAIQVSNVAYDAVVLLVRSNTDPESGLDLSQTQNQRIIVQAAAGLGMASDAQDDPSTTGSAVVILSKVGSWWVPPSAPPGLRRHRAARLPGTPAIARTSAAMYSHTGW